MRFFVSLYRARFESLPLATSLDSCALRQPEPRI